VPSYHLKVSGYTLDYLLFLILIAILHLFLKYAYSYDFHENMYRPRVYFRATVARSKHFFAGYRTISTLASLLTLAALIQAFYMGRERVELKGRLLAVGLLFVYLLIATTIFQWKDSRFSRLNFLKFIYLNHAAFWLLPVLFLLAPWLRYEQLSAILLASIALLFYLAYLPLEWKMARDELHLKAVFNILYLCITEIVPIAGIIYVITDSL